MLALLARRFGDLDLAEDALAEAFASAAGAWKECGIPDNPPAWLLTAARRKALDRLRRRATAADHAHLLAGPTDEVMIDPDALPDERLSLIFTCCHPALAMEARVALTLRLVAGLATPEIARLFLVTEPTMAARLTRAKHKIAAARIPFHVPGATERAERLAGVLAIIYLLFTEGYSASSGDAPIREPLAAEAIRLGELLHALLPHEGEVAALLALMLFQHARRDARSDAAGEIVLLADQNRTLWHEDEIARGHALLAGVSPGEGAYRLQAEIAAAHCRPGAVASDWPAIAALYARLECRTGSPVVRLNRAVAVAEVEGARAGLALLEGLEERLPRHRQLPLVRGELLARTGDVEAAAGQLEEAMARITNLAEKRHIARRIAALRLC